MDSPRLRRLILDAEKVLERFQNWPMIQIQSTRGVPPEYYQIVYHLRGIAAEPDGRIVERNMHIAEIEFTLGYPRRAPQCRMLTPIFHPNFDQSSICIGDFWAASEGLDDLIIRIGRMITYQEYNVKSPLNGLAARWAAENGSKLPVDGRDAAPPHVTQPNESQDKVVVDPEVLMAPISSASDEGRSLPPAYERPLATDETGPSLNWSAGRFVLALGNTSIGSDPNNAICLAERSVGAQHASIYYDGNSILLSDLGAATGTYVNGRKLNGEKLLAFGDRLRMGNTEMFLRQA